MMIDRLRSSVCILPLLFSAFCIPSFSLTFFGRSFRHSSTFQPNDDLHILEQVSEASSDDMRLSSESNSRINECVVDRRKAVLLQSIAVINTLAGPMVPTSFAMDIINHDEIALPSNPASTLKKPFASLQALLPATRVKLTIDKAIIAAAAVDADCSKALTDLTRLLLIPQNYTQTDKSVVSVVPKQPAKQYMNSYKQTREQMPLLAQPGAALVQRGEIMTWKRLKRRERDQESQDEIRAAFNVYTNELSFDAERYALANKSLQNQLIREDRLPDVKSVITSDMGMRYLYRNEVLDALAEARAELMYQLRQQEEEEIKAVSLKDLLQLLEEARYACDRWFSLIDERDVKEALEIVIRE